MEVLVGGMMENPRWMADLDLRNTYLQNYIFSIYGKNIVKNDEEKIAAAGPNGVHL